MKEGKILPSHKKEIPVAIRVETKNIAEKRGRPHSCQKEFPIHKLNFLQCKEAEVHVYFPPDLGLAQTVCSGLNSS